MKKKYFLYGGAGIAVVAIAVFLILFFKKKGETYRTILVLETKGDVTVQRDGGSITAYQDMRLRNGDGMSVPGSGLARLKLDEDKFVYLEENTTISLQAAGTAADSRTIIYVEEGNMLTEIQQKLSDDSSYDVVTPNTTMAIRGTVTQTIVRKGMADADTPVTEYSGEDGAGSASKTGNQRLCWITDIFIYEGTVSVTVYNVDGADIVYRNRTLTAGNGIHVVTPVEETAGNDYVRQFQVDNTRVYWGPRDTRPDGQTGKVREATDKLDRGISHISLPYAASYFPSYVDPKNVKGAGGKLDDDMQKTILGNRKKKPTTTPTPDPTPETTPDPTPETTPDPTPEITPELTPEVTPETTPEPNNGNANNQPANKPQTNQNNNQNNQQGNTQQGNTQQGNTEQGNTEQGTTTEPANGNDNGTTTQTGDDNGTTTQTGDGNGTTTQTGDDNGTTAQTGDDNGTTAQTGDGTNGQAVTPVEGGGNGKTEQPIIENPSGDDNGDDTGDINTTKNVVVYHDFDPDDPSVTENQEYDSDDGLGDFLIPDNSEDYMFMGWLDEDGNPVEVIPGGTTGTVNLYADWQRYYPIYFVVSNDLTLDGYYFPGEIRDSDTFPSADELNLPNGTRFIGWADEEGVISKGISPDTTGPVTLYALTEQIRTITYYLDPDVPYDAGEEYATYVVGVGRGYGNLPEVTIDKSRTFIGWSTQAYSDVTTDIGSEYDVDVELYAVWEYTITYYSGGSLAGTTTYRPKDHSYLLGGGERNWYLPGQYENTLTDTDTFTTGGNKILYENLNDDTVYIVYLNADGTFYYSDETVYEGVIAVKEPPEGYTTWYGTNGTNVTIDYDTILADDGFVEHNCNSDMFLIAGN